MSSKVDDFGTNRKCICDFLLVINSNCGPILLRFRDTAKNCLFFLPLSHWAPWLPWFPLEFRAEVNHEETRVMGLSYSEDPMIVALVVLTSLGMHGEDFDAPDQKRRVDDVIVMAWVGARILRGSNAL